MQSSSFYIVAREPGAENPSIPTWASSVENPLALVDARPAVERVELESVPGAYQLFKVLSPEECQTFIDVSESLGYLPDAAVSLPRDIRHNDNLVWVIDDSTHAHLWQRVAVAVTRELQVYGNKRPLGLNARFRFYRYGPGDYFQFHSDGAWPGSRVVNSELIANAYPDRYSQASFLIYLNADYEGGATRFLVNADDPAQPARKGAKVKEVDVHTPAGGVLCFPHGAHPLHCVHSSEPIHNGTKYIIRTDLLMEW